MKVFIQLVGGSIIGWYAFRAARSGNLIGALIAAVLYIAISYMR